MTDDCIGATTNAGALHELRSSVSMKKEDRRRSSNYTDSTDFDSDGEYQDADKLEEKDKDCRGVHFTRSTKDGDYQGASDYELEEEEGGEKGLCELIDTLAENATGISLKSDGDSGIGTLLYKPRLSNNSIFTAKLGELIDTLGNTTVRDNDSGKSDGGGGANSSTANGLGCNEAIFGASDCNVGDSNPWTHRWVKRAEEGEIAWHNTTYSIGGC